MRTAALRTLLGGPLILALIVSVVCAGGRDLAGPDIERLQALQAPTPQGVTTFRAETPDAPASRAWRDNADLADKTGRFPAPTGGYELRSRVIVRTDDPGPLLALAHDHPGTTIAAFDAVPGFWIVTMGSVREAATAAARLSRDERIREAYLDVSWPKALRDVPTDPYFFAQWHLKNDTLPIADVNAEPAWDAGFTGAGVVVGILEAGWQYDHPDLAANFNAEGTQPGGDETAHATSVAGVAAAVAYNDLGGASIAYGAQISGQLYGSDSETAAAFEYRNDVNDIKSNSWGPTDNGTIWYMSSIERAAIENSIATGRGGLGEVFVWAAGNGGTRDRVDYDPYASSRFTCAVGAIGDLDGRAGYNETGSSMLAVAQSSGNSRSIYTTTNNDGYTFSFGGTSASAPLAAGVIAMMLEANPQLTWRDVQHVLINSARQCDPYGAGWTTNAGGHQISYDYGFGAVDAYAAVTLAASWTNVGPELLVDTGVIPVNQDIPDNDPLGLRETVEIADDIRIESVELILNVDTTYVGDLQVLLTGPQGTESVLATRRGDSKDDYVDYIFTSLRHWDESSAGTWTVEISDRAAGDYATWIDYRLMIYGTEIADCPADLNRDGIVNQPDLGILLAAWMNSAAGDIDRDGDTDADDLNLLLESWGQECP